MRRFETVLFDLDGTLSESAPGITRSLQYAMKEVMGIYEPDLSAFRHFIGPPLNVEFQRCYNYDSETTKKLISKFQERYAVIGIFETEQYPGTAEMMKKCKEAGLTLAVASSKPEPYVYKVMEHLGLDGFCDVICGSDPDLEMRNKAGADNKAQIVRTALSRLKEKEPGLSEEEFKKTCAMVGDRMFDMQGAIANNVTPVGVSFGYGTRQELEENHAAFIADNMEELAEILTAQEDAASDTEDI